MPYDHSATAEISREAALLLCCARTCREAEQAERLRTLLGGALDWDMVLDLAQQHGLMPLLYWHLQALCSDAVPSTIIEALQTHFHANAQHNLLLTRELLSILRLFAAHDIPVVPFKGPVLAAMAYQNLALRQFGDLDLLVPQHHIYQAATLLVAHGYQTTAPYTEPLTAADRFNYYIFTRHDGYVRVDMQWCITGVAFSFAVDTDEAWLSQTSISLAGVTVPTFSPEDLLLILCIHGTKHRWAELKWLCDVAELLRTQPVLDWERVLARARQTYCTRMLFLGLYLVRECLGVQLPGEVAHRLQADAVVPSLGAKVRDSMFAPATTTHHGFRQFVFYCRSMDGLIGKGKYCLPYVRAALRRFLQPNAKDRALLRLPASCAFLYYVLRPLRLLVKYGCRLRQLKIFLLFLFDMG